MKTTEVKTTFLNNKLEVTAKLYKGDLFAVTYCNYTQAKKAADKLGEGWEVYSFGRPFFVGKS